MAVYKICYKYLESPMNDGEVKEVVAGVGDFVFNCVLEPSMRGRYKIEYWAVDDTGKESDHLITDLDVKPFVAPKPVVGGMFMGQVLPESMEARLNKGNVTLLFSRLADGFGFAFDWSQMDLSGVVIEQSSLQFSANSWLGSYILQHKASFVADFFVGKGKQLFITYNGCEYLAINSVGVSQLEKLPTSARKIIDNVQWIDGRLRCRVLKPATFIWK